MFMPWILPAVRSQLALSPSAAMATLALSSSPSTRMISQELPKLLLCQLVLGLLSAVLVFALLVSVCMFNTAAISLLTPRPHLTGVKVDYATIIGPQTGNQPVTRHRVWITRGQFFGTGTNDVLSSPYGGASMLDFSAGNMQMPTQVFPVVEFTDTPCLPPPSRPHGPLLTRAF